MLKTNLSHSLSITQQRLAHFFLICSFALCHVFVSHLAFATSMNFGINLKHYKDNPAARRDPSLSHSCLHVCVLVCMCVCALVTFIHSITPLFILCSIDLRALHCFFFMPKSFSQSMMCLRWLRQSAPSEQMRPVQQEKKNQTNNQNKKKINEIFHIFLS